MDVQSISMDFLNAQAQPDWNLMVLPSHVSYATSVDGTTFGNEVKVSNPNHPNPKENPDITKVPIHSFRAGLGTLVNARYVKVHGGKHSSYAFLAYPRRPSDRNLHRSDRGWISAELLCASWRHQKDHLRRAPTGPELLDLAIEVQLECLGNFLQPNLLTVNGVIFNSPFPRVEKTDDSGMEIPPAMHTATAINFQATGEGSCYPWRFCSARQKVLREVEQSHGPTRNPDLYFFTFFGQPTGNGAWGWRYEGHHCSQNWTIVNGKSIGSSPQFFGANPAEVRSGPMKGARVLSAEEDLGRSLVNSLSIAQRAEAILSSTAPADIVTTNQRKAAIKEDTGIAYSKLSQDQQGTLLALIEEYLSAQPQPEARQRLDKIRRAGFDQIRFAWRGGLKKGEGHYYRVQGSTFLIEYDNTQDNANHIHCVWRDFQGDWGEDLLSEHYRTSLHNARVSVP